MSMAQRLVGLIPSHNDKRLALFWLQKLRSIRSDVPSVKRGRNDFLEYYLNVLRDAVYTAALRTSRGMHLTPRARLKLKEELRHLGECGRHPYILEEVLKVRGADYMCRWSTDKRTYVAVQPIPGRGAMIYMAVTDNPESGWAMPASKPPPLQTL